jgi:hypothetical protein
MRRWLSFALLTMVVSSCMVGEDEDQDATEVQLSSLTADVATTLLGKFQLADGGQQAFDLPNLNLQNNGIYVRVRCYHAACAEPVAETGQFKLVKTSTGKTFVRFYRFAWVNQAAGTTTEQVVDAYEYRKTASGLSLRKTYTTRWIDLDAVDSATLCAQSGGAWHADQTFPGAAAGTTTHCNCGQSTTAWPSPQFVPGAGGCVLPPAIDETTCDATHGQYTDDDPDALGDFCVCPNHTQRTATGCQAI